MPVHMGQDNHHNNNSQVLQLTARYLLGVPMGQDKLTITGLSTADI